VCAYHMANLTALAVARGVPIVWQLDGPGRGEGCAYRMANLTALAVARCVPIAGLEAAAGVTRDMRHTV
jgi:hypothetical protein